VKGGLVNVEHDIRLQTYHVGQQLGHKARLKMLAPVPARARVRLRWSYTLRTSLS